MDENQAEGAANVAVGKLEREFGAAIGDGAMQIRGVGRQVEGHVQEAAGAVQEAYGRVSGAARGLAERVGERPYFALGLAASAGVLIGLALAGRGPRVIYVKPKV